MADTQLHQDILMARLRACAERRNGDTLSGQAWDAEAAALEHRLILLDHPERRHRA